MRSFRVLSLIAALAVVAPGAAQTGRTSRAPKAVAPAAAAPAAPPGMTNQDVLTMVEAGLDEGVIVAAIRKAAATQFDTTPAALVALKKASVPPAVVRTMIDPAATEPVPAAAAPVTPTPAVSQYPTEMGMYHRQPDQSWKELDPEIVNWKSGGMLKNIATAGIAGAHINGTVQGPRSHYVVTMPAELLVVTAEGTSITEYQLLDMWEKSSRREFRAAKVSMLGASGGAKNNVRTFAHEKLASRTYLVKLDALARGQWGFLPPGGIASGNMASSGKIYTFSVD